MTGLVRALTTGQPHSLSANVGVLRLGVSQYPSTGHSKHDRCGAFLGRVTWRSDKLDVHLLILNWKTGIPLLNMPIRVWSWFDPVYRLCPRPQSGQQQVPPPAIIRNYVLEGIRTRHFFPDISASGGASLGHFYTDASQRVFGVQIEVASLSANRETVQELLVPVEAPKASARSPVYRCAAVSFEPFIGRQLAYASRAAE